MSHYLHSKEKMSRSVLMLWHNMGFPCLKKCITQFTTNTPRIYCYVPSRGSFTFPFSMASCGLRKKCSCLRNAIRVIKFQMCYHCMPLNCFEHYLNHFENRKRKLFYKCYLLCKHKYLSFEVIIFFATYLYILAVIHNDIARSWH